TKIRNTSLVTGYMQRLLDQPNFPMVLELQSLRIKIRRETQNQPATLLEGSSARKPLFYQDILSNLLEQLMFYQLLFVNHRQDAFLSLFAQLALIVVDQHCLGSGLK